MLSNNLLKGGQTSSSDPSTAPPGLKLANAYAHVARLTGFANFSAPLATLHHLSLVGRETSGSCGLADWEV